MSALLSPRPLLVCLLAYPPACILFVGTCDGATLDHQPINENPPPPSSLIRCECREGGFGALCEYESPCLTVSTEGTGLPSEYNGEYKILKEDPSELAALDDNAAPFFKRANLTMTASLRPVYVRRAGTDNASATVVVFHDGMRWAMVETTKLERFTDLSLGKNPKDSQLIEFFRVQKITDACLYARMSDCMHLNIWNVCMYLYICMHARTCMHTRMPTCTNTYIVGDLLPSAEFSHVFSRRRLILRCI
jgi:hypothetical protein